MIKLFLGKETVGCSNAYKKMIVALSVEYCKNATEPLFVAYTLVYKMLTALWKAVRSDNILEVKRLLDELRMDVNAGRTDIGSTPL